MKSFAVVSALCLSAQSVVGFAPLTTANVVKSSALFEASSGRSSQYVDEINKFSETAVATYEEQRRELEDISAMLTTIREQCENQEN
ncbi:expressed unknown protein [Seminavis robusta]|uniref:Uncharacterized protein n=1 Tax=Seminavis robusta TaxID=568900 RepID=A0A9N8E290_9STRA|nr:expressed unknown protein [Seminavis robusta]|eukprot:Sro471_g149790.1 n/a (87) ;mRNA; r:57684-57944